MTEEDKNLLVSHLKYVQESIDSEHPCNYCRGGEELDELIALICSIMRIGIQYSDTSHRVTFDPPYDSIPAFYSFPDTDWTKQRALVADWAEKEKAKGQAK